jgi:hypothetical protein
LSGAGEVVQRSQIAASQVPRLVAVFQSHSSVARRPQAQRRRRCEEQTIAAVPLGKTTCSHSMSAAILGERGVLSVNLELVTQAPGAAEGFAEGGLALVAEVRVASDQVLERPVLDGRVRQGARDYLGRAGEPEQLGEGGGDHPDSPTR